MAKLKSIYLFPFGGGGAASYRSYARNFPPDTADVIPVEIPGRGRRSSEDCAGSIRECAERSLDELDAGTEDYVLHGHCMGALLAFEATRMIEQSDLPPPKFMVASGRNAPGLVNDWLRRVPDMDDRELFDELRGFGGIPTGLSPAMARPFLNVLRNDQAMIRDYDPEGTRVHVPILALAGRDDRMTTATGLSRWERYTSRFVSIEWLDGAHYSILDQPDRVASYVNEFSARIG